MPRKPNIPFGDKRRAELNRVNRNITNKQKSLEKRFGMQADFEKKSAADFSSVKEFNEYVAAAKNFTKRTANRFDLVNNEGTHISFRTLNKVEKEIKRINRIKDREFSKLKDLPHMEMGRKTGLTIGESVNKKIGFSDPKFDNFKPLNFTPSSYAGERDALLHLNKLKEKYDKDFIAERDNQYWENYLQSLKTVFNQSANPLMYHLDDVIWDVHDAIMDMGMEKFMQLYYQGKIPSIAYIYGKDMKEAKLDELQQAFKLGDYAE